MPKTKPKSHILVRLALGVITTVLLAFGVVLIGQGLINTKNYRDQFVRIIHEQTGRDITIKGSVSVSLLPTQSLFVSSVELRDPTSDTPAPAMTVEMIRIDVSPLSIFSQHPKITGITLTHPVLEVTRAKDNLIHWEWVNISLLKSLEGKQDSTVPVNVEDGKIVYYDNRSETALTTENIRLYTTIGKSFAINGSFMYTGHVIQFALDSNGNTVSKSGSTTPLNLKLFNDPKNFVQLQGSLDFSADAPKIQGKLDVELENVMMWIGLQATQEQKKFDPFDTSHKAAQQDDYNNMSLKLTGDWSQDGLNMGLTNIVMKGFESEGKGAINLSWLDWQPNFTSTMEFTKLNYDKWKILATNIFAKKVSTNDNPYGQRNKLIDNPIPKDFQSTLTVSADELSIGTQTWKNAKISAKLADAAITVNEFNIELPGEAKLGLFGIISQGSTGGLRFEGSMETSGKSLRQLLTIFDESASDLPETGFGDFFVHSNIFISPEQMRLSEATVKISDLKLNGGLVAYFDSTNPRLEADMHLKDINFDYFRDEWRKKQREAKTEKFFLQFDRTSSYNWLKKLQTTIDLKVNVDGFTFLDRKGDTSSFRLFVRQNEFGIYDIVFNYPDESTAGGFRLDVKGEQPYVDVTLNTNTLDTNYFTLNDDKPSPDDTDKAKDDAAPPAKPTDKPVDKKAKAAADAKAAKEAADKAAADKVREDQKWSEDLIDMGWMEGFNGAFNLSIGKLIHGDITLTGIKLQTMLDHNLLTFQNFNFGFWQARCSVLGAIYGGKVPGISVSYTLNNAELSDTLKSLTKRDNLSGKVNVNGTLTTSGVNILSWVEQSDAKIIMNGNVHAQGVNMQGVVDAVNVSRTAADVFNNVNLALVNGSTDFSVGGNINVKNGVMQTPGIYLKTGSIIGNFRGDINLVPWTLNMSTLFQFPAMPSETVPTLTVQIVGPFDGPELRTDTSSLEAYITSHIKGE